MSEFSTKVKILLSYWKLLSDPGSRNFEVSEFETKLKKYFKNEYAVALASGTDALILALKAFNIGPGDEVIVSALGFPSTAAAPIWVGAKPVFVDVDYESFNLNPNLLGKAITENTKAIIAVHLNGRLADMENIGKISKSHGIFVIEDAAQAVGTEGGFSSDAVCLSFNPMKMLTGYGDGGAVLTNNPEIAKRLNFLRTYGASSFAEIGLSHPYVGLASHLSPFHAAAMNMQFANLDKKIESARKNFSLYCGLLKGTGDLVIPSEEKKGNSYRFVILTSKRNELQKFLTDNGIDARNHYAKPLPYMEAFKNLGCQKGQFPASEKISIQSLSLPTFNISENDLRQVAESIKKFFNAGL